MDCSREYDGDEEDGNGVFPRLPRLLSPFVHPCCSQDHDRDDERDPWSSTVGCRRSRLVEHVLGVADMLHDIEESALFLMRRHHVGLRESFVMLVLHWCRWSTIPDGREC